MSAELPTIKADCPNRVSGLESVHHDKARRIEMNQIQLSLDELGRILIPAPVRDRLHLSPGMTLIVEKGDNGGLRLRIQLNPTTLVEKDGVLVARVRPVSDLANVTRLERDRRVFSLLQRTGL